MHHTPCIISRLLCFIEVLWDLAGLKCVDRAEDDQDHVVEQRHDDRERGHLLSHHDAWDDFDALKSELTNINVVMR